MFAKVFLLLTSMLGTSMVIGDGVLTPCISGLITHSITLHFFKTALKLKHMQQENHNTKQRKLGSVSVFQTPQNKAQKPTDKTSMKPVYQQ
jgi:hypothetical protein